MTPSIDVPWFQLLITGEHELDIRHIWGVRPQAFCQSLARKGIGIKVTFAPSFVSQLVSSVVTKKINMGKDVKDHDPVTNFTQKSQDLHPEINVGDKCTRHPHPAISLPFCRASVCPFNSISGI